MANVKVFAETQTDKQTNGQTEGLTNERTKNYMPPIYRCGGMKTHTHKKKGGENN